MLLKRGVMNAQVSLLQVSLNRVLTAPQPLKEDGIFGPKTEDRVRTFQSRKSLKPDGIVGPLTLNSLFVRKSINAKISFLPSQKPTPQPPFPWFFNPLKMDPRDVGWALEWKAYLDWAGKPPPKPPGPPFPSTLPPSLSLPPAAKYLPGPIDGAHATTPITVKSGKLPPSGGNIEVSFGTGVIWNPSKTLKPKMQELELTVDFSQFIGIGQGSPLATEVQTTLEDNGNFRTEVKITAKGEPIVKHQSPGFDFKLIPLIVTAIGTPFDEATGFVGAKGTFEIRPFGNGASIEIGGKFGAKGRIATDDNGTTVSAYPLQVDGFANLKLEFP